MTGVGDFVRVPYPDAPHLLQYWLVALIVHRPSGSKAYVCFRDGVRRTFEESAVS